MSRPTLRFAPSPNGRLHLGHAYSALLNDRIAGALGGIWLLRIEDIDLVRATPENVRGIVDDLRWLGLRWPEPVLHQSSHMPRYVEAADRLRSIGFLYRCFCTRGDIASGVEARRQTWPRDPDGSPLYPGTCRHLTTEIADSRARAGEPHAWRLDMSRATQNFGALTWRAFGPEDQTEQIVVARPQRWGDPVIVRKDVPTSYHLSVVVDDAAQGITHVVRGRDLLLATDLHALLARHLDLPLPTYHHHELLRAPDGSKLSKSRGSESLASLRVEGATPAEIRHRLGFG